MKLKDLSLEEKIKLLVGASDGSACDSEDLDGKVYRIKMVDGPIGPHFYESFTWLPSITTLASSWNTDLVKDYVDVIADECITNKVDLLLGPAINIKRLALCGRNFEYFSEDPYLTGTLGSEYVETLQARGIGATVKHFCANNREFARLYCSSNISERALREIYVKAFEMICEKEPWAIMCSYNKINGVYGAENEHTLVDILRKDIGFKNLIMSDWGAVHDRAKSLKTTLDLAMPYQGPEAYESVKKALKDGYITEKDIDFSLERLEALIDKIVKNKSSRIIKYSQEQRHQIAVKTVEEGLVLLKNDDGILPLKKEDKVLIVGEQAIEPELGGGGSCNLGDHPDEPFDERLNVNQFAVHDLLNKHFGNNNTDFIAGYHLSKGFGLNYQNLHSSVIVERAKNYDKVVIFVGTNRVIECEGYDRENLKLPLLHRQLINEVCAVHDNVIVVITAGGVIDTSEFKDKVKGIVYLGFGGEGANEGIANVLSGKVNPSGKLAETFISSMKQNPYVDEVGSYLDEDYRDDIFVGYRLYATEGIKVEYPFGYGLSYTKFKYSNLVIEEKGDGVFEIKYDITNIGEIPGKEISQIYISKPDSKIKRPLKELKGFNKVNLLPNETKTISVKLDKKAFEYFDEQLNCWALEKGEYQILVGSSVNDIKLIKSIIIK